MKTIHVAYKGDYAIDLCDGPHLLEVNLLRGTGAQGLVGNYFVYIEPKSSFTDNSIHYDYREK